MRCSDKVSKNFKSISFRLTCLTNCLIVPDLKLSGDKNCIRSALSKYSTLLIDITSKSSGT